MATPRIDISFTSREWIEMMAEECGVPLQWWQLDILEAYLNESREE